MRTSDIRAALDATFDAASGEGVQAVFWEQLPLDLWCCVFFHAGPDKTALASAASKQFCTLVQSADELWRQFLDESFGLYASESVRNMCRIYAYLAQQMQLEPRLIPSEVVFSDDGTPYPGYPPQSALGDDRRCWCTRSGVDRNVDLVTRFRPTYKTGIDRCSSVHLVTSFTLVNPDRGFTAPMRSALLWACRSAPDLEAARRWDDYTPDSADANLTQTNSFPKFVQFSNYPDCRGERIEVTCSPTTAEYAHFKLLDSWHPPEQFSTNIDVGSLLVYGIPVPELSYMLKEACEPHAPTQDPSYRRIHMLRTRQ